MDDLYVLTGGNGNLGKKYIKYLSKFNEEILCIDLIENNNAKYNITTDLTKEITIYKVDQFLSKLNKINNIKFIHLAGIIGESNNKDWVTNINNLGIEKSELCYTLSVTMPAKLISIFTKYNFTNVVFINSIYGTHTPDFSLYKENPNLQNPLSYGSIKAAQIYSMKWLNQYYKNKVRINSVSPGGIESPNMDLNFKTLYKNKTLGNEFCTPEDVIFTSEYLLSEKGKSLYNQNLFLDYGFK